MYTVGEMAKLLGVPSSTLRYYDKVGLLPFVERSENGIRIFKDEDYSWLKIIECLKMTGMQLKDIREFILMAMQGDKTIDSRLELIKNQRDFLLKKISDYENMLKVLNYKCWFYENAQIKGSTEEIKNMQDCDIPSEFVEVRKKLTDLHGKNK